LVIAQEDIFITDWNEERPLSLFADTAIQSYRNLSVEANTEWVLTGQWLERLATEAAIHPVMAKKLVAQAREANILQVFAEGSTPDTRFDRHKIWILRSTDGSPALSRQYLYHGNLLIPGTSSVRIKIQGVHHAP
jgi:hypothetical protein